MFSPAIAQRLKASWPWLLGFTAVAGALGFVVPRISRDESHAGRMVLAAIALLLVQAMFWVRERAPEKPQLKTALTALWALAALYGAFNYYQHNQKMLTRVEDYSDATYYYLNSKYFSELGYANLYEAMLVADDEGPKRLAKVKRYRDLTTYVDIHSRSRALRRADVVKAPFSPERWRGFSDDLSFLTKREVKGGFEYFFIDHGYNPPPPWTFIGGSLSDLVSVRQLKWLTSIDIVLVGAAMIAIARTFGLSAMLVALSFFLCTFSGRWPVLGQSILRFDWLTALVFAVCALRKGRHGLAGAGLAYAACNRIFPGIFALPYLAWIARKWLEDKRMPRELIRFVAGAMIVTLIVAGGAWVRYGSSAYREASERLALHGSPESFSSHRVGLGHVLLYRGEWTRKELDVKGGMDAKRAQLWGIYPELKIVGLVCMLAVLAYAFRSKQPPHRLIWLAIFPLFCLTNPQINYYNLRLLLVIGHAERFRHPIDRVGLSVLFATEVATQAVHVLGADRYAVTATTSYGLLIYLVTMAGFLVRGSRDDGDQLDDGAKSSTARGDAEQPAIAA